MNNTTLSAGLVMVTLLLALPLMAACDSAGGSEGGDDGLRITTITLGMDQDTDGYRVMINGTQEIPIGTNETINVPLEGETFELELVGAASNCTVKNNPTTVTAGANSVTFRIQCGLKGKISFACGGTNTALTLCITRSDGSERTELPFRRGVGFTAFSPDGSKIVYSTAQAYTDLWVYYLDGSPETPIALDVVASEAGDLSPSEPGHPSWSRDGSKIAFSANAQDFNTGAPVGARDIYIMNPDGSNVVNLTNSDSLWYNGPSWSPDGSQLAFMGFAPPQAEPTIEANFGDIYVINADGTNLRNITAGTPQASLVGYANVAPQWSPIDNRIVFSAAPAIGQRWGTWAVYMIDSNGANLTKISADDNRELAYYASWRPDGEWLVFTWNTPDDDCEMERLAIMRPDGSERQFISEECPQRDPEQRSSWTLGEGS